MCVYSDLLLIYCNFWANTCRKLRKRDASKFNIQLCLAMFLMLLVFVVGVERTENTIGCTIASVLIQYFTLASVFWMGAEAVLMFKKLIIVFGRISTTFIVVVSVICWGMYKHIIVVYYVLTYNIILYRCTSSVSCCGTDNISL